MTSTKTNVTKEWHKCRPFETLLQELWTKDSDIQFTRQELHDRINRGDFGDNLVATFSPKDGSVEETFNNYKNKGQDWLDIQNLTYHYSHQNPNGNYRSMDKMLEHVSGRGANAVYKLHKTAFESR